MNEGNSNTRIQQLGQYMAPAWGCRRIGSGLLLAPDPVRPGDRAKLWRERLSCGHPRSRSRHRRGDRSGAGCYCPPANRPHCDRRRLQQRHYRSQAQRDHWQPAVQGKHHHGLPGPRTRHLAPRTRNLASPGGKTLDETQAIALAYKQLTKKLKEGYQITCADQWDPNSLAYARQIIGKTKAREEASAARFAEQADLQLARNQALLTAADHLLPEGRSQFAIGI